MTESALDSGDLISTIAVVAQFRSTPPFQEHRLARFQKLFKDTGYKIQMSKQSEAYDAESGLWSPDSIYEGAARFLGLLI